MSHKPTDALRKRVAIAAGGGMLHEDIALAIGVTPPTLRKHYANELSVGAHKRRMDVLEAAYDGAVAGKVAAQRLYLSVMPGSAAPDLDDEPDPVAKPLGKKAEANEVAKTAHAGTDWEDLLNRPGAPLVQ
jgi:hypothetical protein